MLFRKKMEQSCDYCIHGTPMADGQMLCTKRGVVTGETACRRFRYDPFKRIPPKPRPLDFQKYQEEDFSL